jgi:hypothetical protein
MRSRMLFGLVGVTLMAAGCYGPGPDGQPVLVVNLAKSPCADVRQVAHTSEATLKYAKELELGGKITPIKLVDIEQRRFLLQTQADSACNFFNRGRISFEQYRGEVQRVTEAMFKLKEDLPAQ